MRIAIIGYGKMGKAIHRIAEERGHSVDLIVDQHNQELLMDPQNLSKVDVAIEFSTPETAVSHILSCIEASTPVVCGTTGWLDRWGEVAERVKKEKGTLFYASNYSVGVYIFSKLNTLLATYMNHLPNYDVAMEEIHHVHKKDAPSGTALSLAKEIVNRVERKSHIITTEESKPRKNPLAPEDLEIVAKRIGETPGTHTVEYSSEIDTITIRHTAHGREGFALGAVMAAEFTQSHSGLLSMDDMMKELLA